MAASISELLKGASTVNALFKLIDKGEIAPALGDIEMSAAKSALEEVPRANDKRNQVWTCIGHLNSAQHAFEQAIRAPDFGFHTMTRDARNGDFNVKRRFILILKAICYKYLNEQVLCQESLYRAETPIPKELTVAQKFIFAGYMFANLASGFQMIELSYMMSKGYGTAGDTYGIDAETFKGLSQILSPDRDFGEDMNASPESSRLPAN